MDPYLRREICLREFQPAPEPSEFRAVHTVNILSILYRDKSSA